MAEIARMRVALTWDNGGPGVNTFHFTKGTLIGSDWEDVGEVFYEELGDLYVLMQTYLINSLTWALEPVFDILDVDTGNITGVATAGGDPISGSGTSTANANSRATMICANYGTDVWANGRRLRGRTFFGPIPYNAINTSGQIGSSDRAAIENGYVALTSGVGPRLAVYSRPGPAPSSTGFYGDVTSVRVKTTPGILRSRRD